ncbi:hypothetical protein HDR66_02910 [bacterium]|nr:hypothetical protein [bacterium]
MKRDIKKDVKDTLSYAFIAALCYIVVTHLHSFDVTRAFGAGDKSSVPAPCDTTATKHDAAVDFNAARAQMNAARNIGVRTR